MAEMNQRNWRHTVNLPDEFGRMWLVNLDKRPEGGGSWGITGVSIPVGWTDPLRMPTSYLDQPVGVAGRPDANRLTVIPGMRKWLDIQKRHEADWKQRAFMVAQRLFGTAAHQMIVAEDESLMQEVGPKPFPSVAVIQEALNGHKGFLGLAPLTKEDRAKLGTQNLEDMGFASEPTVTESNPHEVETPAKPVAYFSFVKQMKDAGITEKDEIKAHWDVYRSQFATK